MTPYQAHVLDDEHYSTTEVQPDDPQYRDSVRQFATYYKHAALGTRLKSVVFQETNNKQMLKYGNAAVKSGNCF